VLIGLWIVYFTIHSMLATTWLKDKLTAFGINLRIQRIVYNLIAIIGLLIIMLYNGSIEAENVFQKTRLLKMSALFLTAVGVLIIRQSFKHYSIKSFLGIESENGSTLVTRKGILKYVRHPIYSGTILIVLGYFLYDPRIPILITILCIYVYLFVGIKLEEAKLLKIYGKKYESYKNEVPAILPKVGKLF